jgi:XRE family aerobic/anaerobic benzoate catabolism transcriptional regulator
MRHDVNPVNSGQVIPLNALRAPGAPALGPDRATEGLFLGELGQKVRHARNRRGLSRKALARLSGISERYIAQLETGKGNMSIVLLRRISAALGTGIAQLLPIDEVAVF